MVRPGGESGVPQKPAAIGANVTRVLIGRRENEAAASHWI